MSDETIAARIAARARRAGVTVSPVLGVSLAAYVDLLARWNRKINLTALDVETPSDDAIDRLIVEPLVAAAHVRPNDDLCVDIGSGGGSPAIPLKLAAPTIRLVLVEAKIRKAGFLRETVRQLGLTAVDVENRRFEELVERGDLRGSASLITVRAVRVDRKLLAGAAALLRPGGRVFWFEADVSRSRVMPQDLEIGKVERLVPDLGSAISILVKTI